VHSGSTTFPSDVSTAARRLREASTGSRAARGGFAGGPPVGRALVLKKVWARLRAPTGSKL
jgi:hypothetical protein